MRKNPASKRTPAERAGEWYLREVCGCVLTRRALRTKFARVDFFAADIIGVEAHGRKIYAQVTAGQEGAARLRRRKLEKIPWAESERVLLLHLRSKSDGRKTRYYFRVSELHAVTEETYWQRTKWVLLHEQDVETHWWKAHREPEGETEHGNKEKG